MKNLTLNNGIEIPIVGIGTNTFGKEGSTYGGELRGDSLEVDLAIKNGYRHIDTAQSYRTEPVVGAGVTKSGVARKEFYIVTKLDCSEGYRSEEWLHEAIQESLDKLETDYIDLFLVHHPRENIMEEIEELWGLLEEYVDKGVFKSIGVSNFNEEQVDKVLEIARIKPVMNQIASYVGKWNHDLIKHNQDRGVAVTAWGPLKNIDNEKLEEIAAKHGVTPAQVVLNYQVNRDVVVIPKSHNEERQAVNLDIFSFELTDEEKEIIASL